MKESCHAMKICLWLFVAGKCVHMLDFMTGAECEAE